MTPESQNCQFAISDVFSSVDSSTENLCQTHIENLANRKISGFCGTIDDNGTYYSKVYMVNASLTESITADYRSRFLIELIQNANDAHPDVSTDGEIEIVFDQCEGEFGTLYVANRGTPFTHRNVNALCDMGLSSKPPGESIGNKGLGFRSIIHITDTPRIYSQAESTTDLTRFAGYCFGFAETTDLEALIPDPRHLKLARNDIPVFHVPIWLEEQPEAVIRYSDRGFATVIVLPLRNASATRAVEREIEAIQDPKAPMLLFLHRLTRLGIRVLSRQGKTDLDITLIRSEDTFATGAATLATANLGNAGRYLVTRRKVPEADIKAAIERGIERKQLHAHWREWEGNGEVALAVRLDDVVTTPRLYTFLPMGEQAIAPFSGYLHGTFFPMSNRQSLDDGIELNSLLLNEATTLAAITIVMLSSNSCPEVEHRLEIAARACAVSDILCWEEVASLQISPDLATQVANKVAANLGVQGFDEAPVVPCYGPQGDCPIIAWRTPKSARPWVTDLATFAPKIAALYEPEMGIAPIWSGLGDRIDKLNGYLFDHSEEYETSPTGNERAELASCIAKALAANTRTSMARWTMFYNDLIVFLAEAPEALANRLLLLCSDKKLRRTLKPVQDEANTKRKRSRATIKTSIFSPPVQRALQADNDLELKPPSKLATRFAFLSDALDWHHNLASARRFLESAKLVLEFDRETVLAQLSSTLRSENNKEILTRGLRWAFQIWRQPRATGRSFKLQPQHRFRVPTTNGEFVDATEAIFSDSWPKESLGDLLQRFLDTAPSDVPDLIALTSRLLAPTKHRAFRDSRIDDWVEFLAELGVQRGIHPVAKEASPLIASAYQLKTFSFCDDLGIPPSAAEAWKKDIETADQTATSFYYSSNYVIKDKILWLPGQGDLDRFSWECRGLYAQLIIEWLDTAFLPSWTIKIHHKYYYREDTRDWPTPVNSFLRSAPWIPAEEPSRKLKYRKQIMVKPSEIWLMPQVTDRFLPFIRRPANQVRSVLERATDRQIDQLKSHAGLRTLNESTTLTQQATFLAQQYAREEFDRYYERHLLKLYHRTWVLMSENVASGEVAEEDIVVPCVLLVRRGHETEILHFPATGEDIDEILYVRDNDNETEMGLVKASRKLLFSVQTRNPAWVGSLLRKFYGPRVKLLSEVEYSFMVDGRQVGEDNVAPILSHCPRLRAMVAVAIEALKGTDLQSLPADRSSIVDKLEHLLLQPALTLSFRIDGTEIVHSGDERRAFFVKLVEGQPIIVTRAPDGVNWDVVNDCLDAICEAIEQRSLISHIRLLVTHLKMDNEPHNVSLPLDLDIDRFASLLRLDEVAKKAARDTLCAGIERHTPWLRAILHMVGGAQAINAFTEVEPTAVQDIALLYETLSPWLQNQPFSADAVVNACKNALSVADLREELDMDFALFNQSLIAVGLEPDTYPYIHANAMATFLHENEIRIIDALRMAHASQLRSKKPAPTYAEARDEIRNIAPDDHWLSRYREPPEYLIAEKVDAWLQSSYGVQLNAADNHDLDTVEEVRISNLQTVRNFATTAHPLVLAWCGKAKVVAPGIWCQADKSAAELRATLDKAGIFDFQILDETSLLKWTRILEVWPEEMPLSLEMVTLDLTPADLDEEKRKAQEKAETVKREARIIPFNGRKIDPVEVDRQELASELSLRLSKQMLSTPLNAQPNLAQVQGKSTRGRTTSPGPMPSPHKRRAPDEKTDLIGYLGEIAVYYWLHERLPKQDIDAAWCSMNAFPITGRMGSDNWGYDFKVSYRKQIWQIEVKSSLNDPRAFEMGESEVRAARAAARNRSGVQYRIAYVSNLTNPSKTEVELLPNPMTEEGESVLSLLGEGIRYGFSRIVS